MENGGRLAERIELPLSILPHKLFRIASKLEPCPSFSTGDETP